MKFQTRDTFSWATLLTEDLIRSRHSNFSYVWSSNIQHILLFSEEIMKLDKSALYMDTMMKQSENMVTQIHGSIVLKFLIIFLLELQLKERSSVFMVGSHLKLRHLIRSEVSTDSWKCHTKAHSVTSCGLIQKISKHGPCHREVQDGCLDQEWPQSSIKLMELNLLQEHTSSSWMVINIGSKIETSLLYGQHLTIATDVEMVPPSWMLMKTSKHHLISSLRTKVHQLFLTRPLCHTFCEHSSAFIWKSKNKHMHFAGIYLFPSSVVTFETFWYIKIESITNFSSKKINSKT